jgi:PAS domain S-box-containing protein
MTVAHRILLHVALGVAFVVAVVTAVTYKLVYDALKQSGLRQLDTYVAERAEREEARFQQVQSNLQLVRGMFLKRLDTPMAPEEIEKQWNHWYRKYPDGAWRSREEFGDARKTSSLWADRDWPATSEMRRQAIIAQELCDEMLPGWVDAFPSYYFQFPAPGLVNVGVDVLLADWAWKMPGHFDTTGLEWIDLALPKGVPPDRFSWTGLQSDDVVPQPLICVFLPVVKEGVFIASVGHNMSMSRMLDAATQSAIPGALHFIFRKDGRLIAHATRRDEILASKGLMKAQDCGDPMLASLYRIASSHNERRFSNFDPLSDTYYSVARLAGPEWFYVTTMSREHLQQQASASARWVLWSGMVSLGLVLAFIATILRTEITRPLGKLLHATEAMRNRTTETPLEVNRPDELGALANSFTHLNAQVALREKELQQLNLDLERRVAQRTEELARFATILDLTPDFVGICDMDQRVVYVNRTGRQLANLPPSGGLEDMKVADFHPPWAYKILDEEALPGALREGIWTGEIALLDHTGHEVPVSAACIVSHDKDGKPQFGATIMRDLTERARVQEELERALEHERELGEMKSNFVSLVSHEFRTPLGVIMSAVEVLQRYFERLPVDKRARHLEMIFRSTRNLAALIEEVLLLSRVEEGRMKFTPVPVDLEKICRTLCDELRSATGAACTIHFQPKSSLDNAVSDEAIIRHILTNLLSNACKYSDPGSSVDFFAERRVDDVIFTVRDYGIGIPHEDQTRLFTSFTRGRNVGTRPGTGLGLVIVQRCVQLVGGTLHLESTVGEGTTVTVSLPVFHHPQVSSPPSP